MWRDFVGLFYPTLCMACNKPLLRKEEIICMHCQATLPLTNYHFENENPISQLFWGRVHVEHATALYHYARGTRIQHLIHQLKYKNQAQVGVYLGQILGKTIADSAFFKDINALIPIPLHPKKEKLRGYNQSEVIANGVSLATGWPVWKDVLVRKEFTETQTKKNRWDRWQNVKNMFEVKNADRIKGKHLLLLDDVITTGATIEACIRWLNECKDVRVSVASLAATSH